MTTKPGRLCNKWIACEMDAELRGVAMPLEWREAAEMARALLTAPPEWVPKDELDLIEAVLKGYPDSPARWDAIRAVGVIRAAQPPEQSAQQVDDLDDLMNDALRLTEASVEAQIAEHEASAQQVSVEPSVEGAPTETRGIECETIETTKRQLADVGKSDLERYENMLEHALDLERSLSAARRELTELKAELKDRADKSSVERLHNLCHAIETERDGSEFSKEEWDRIDAENLRLRNELERKA